MKPWGRLAVAMVAAVGAMALLPRMSAGAVVSAKTDVDLTSKEVGSKETAIGNLVTDAIRASAKSDAAFLDASSFADPGVTVGKGNFTSSDILKALEQVAKGDSIVVVKLTGDQITRALEHGFYLYPKTNSGFLQSSGLIVIVNPDAEAEKRIVSIKIGGDSLSGSKTYRVAMPSPLANGALGYYKFWKKSDSDKETKETLESAVTSYLTDHKSITKGDERIVIKGK